MIDGRRHAPFTGWARTRRNLHLLFQSSHKTPHTENWPNSTGEDSLNSGPFTQTHNQYICLDMNTNMLYLCTDPWTGNEKPCGVTQGWATPVGVFLHLYSSYTDIANTSAHNCMSATLFFCDLQINVLQMPVNLRLLKKPPTSIQTFTYELWCCRHTYRHILTRLTNLIVFRVRSICLSTLKWITPYWQRIAE